MSSSILYLLILATAVYAQNNDRICSWYRPRFGTVRDALYVDGGTIYETSWQDGKWSSSNPTQTYPSGVLHAFNFSNAFEGNEPVDLRKLMTDLPLTGGGVYDAPDFMEGAMFANDLELYTYGGTPRSDASSDKIINYRLYPAEGQTIFTAGPKTGIELNGVNNFVTSGGYASSPTESKGWFFSGMRAATWGPLAQNAQDDGSDPRAITNLSSVLITADTHLPGDATWTNTTLPSEVRPRVNPELVWLPVGEQGALLAIGGVAYHYKYENFALTKEQVEESEVLNPLFMEQIPIYDVKLGDWHLQNTTGGGPPYRAEFCSVVAADPNDSRSYDIFIYGGDNGLSGTPAHYAMDDVWVLSVPAFVWTQANAGTLDHGRSGHVCAKPFDNQMLVIGGQNLNSTNFCIQDGSVADVFDLNTHEWTRKYSWDTSAAYQRHESITAAISNAAELESEVKALFDTTYPKKVETWYPYADPGSATNGTNNSNGTDTAIITSSSKSNAGAIAGGVVGGVAVIAGAFLIFWFCRPARRRARRSKHESTTAYSETTADSSAVSRWLRRTTFNHPPAKQVEVTEGSVTDASGDDNGPIVPASHALPPTRTDLGPAEVHGDSRFRSEMSSNDDIINSPRSSAAFSGTTAARTRHTSIEAGSSQIHEMLDESTISPRSSTQAGPQGPGRPYTWGRQSTFGQSAIDEEINSSGELPTPSNGGYPYAATVSDIQPHSTASELGGVSRPSADISSTAAMSQGPRSRTSLNGPSTASATTALRPALDRNRSSGSISAEAPTGYSTPFATPLPYAPGASATDARPPSSPSTAAQMSAISPGPISPLLTPDGHQRQAAMARAGGILATAQSTSQAAEQRPPNNRHNSSMISALSEDERRRLDGESRKSVDATMPDAPPMPAQTALMAQVEEDRRAAERILAGEQQEKKKPEMSQVRRSETRRVGSSGSMSGRSRFVEDVGSTGENR